MLPPGTIDKRLIRFLKKTKPPPDMIIEEAEKFILAQFCQTAHDETEVLERIKNDLRRALGLEPSPKRKRRSRLQRGNDQMSDEELVAMIAHGTKTLYQSSKDLAVIERMALKYNLAEAIRYLRLRQSINAEMLNLFLEAGMISA